MTAAGFEQPNNNQPPGAALYWPMACARGASTREPWATAANSPEEYLYMTHARFALSRSHKAVLRTLVGGNRRAYNLG